MLNNLTGWHFLIILVVVLLLFGAPKLPGLARSLGQSMKIFKNEIKTDKVDDDPYATPATPATSSKPSSVDDTTRASGSTDTSTKP